MKGKTAIIIILLSLILVVAGYLLFSNSVFFGSKLTMNNSNTVEESKDSTPSSSSDDPFSIALTKLQKDNLKENEEIVLLNQLHTIAVNDYKEDKEDKGFKENIVTLYQVLFDVILFADKTPEHKATIVIMIDRLFWETDFNTQLFYSALQKASYDPYLANYQGKTRYEQVYKSLYDINEYAYSLVPDKFIAGFQAWSVGISVLESAPPTDLSDEFAAYISDQVYTYESTDDILEKPNSQKLWLEQSLQSVKTRLGNAYPGKYTF